MEFEFFLCSLDWDHWKKIINGVSIIVTDNKNLVPYSDLNRFNGGSLLRWPSSLLEDLCHNPRHPPQQTIRQRRYFSDRTRSAEISGMVSRRIGFRVPRRSQQEIGNRRLSEASFRRRSVRNFLRSKFSKYQVLMESLVINYIFHVFRSTISVSFCDDNVKSVKQVMDFVWHIDFCRFVSFLLLSWDLLI